MWRGVGEVERKERGGKRGEGNFYNQFMIVVSVVVVVFVVVFVVAVVVVVVVVFQYNVNLRWGTGRERWRRIGKDV